MWTADSEGWRFRMNRTVRVRGGPDSGRGEVLGINRKVWRGEFPKLSGKKKRGHFGFIAYPYTFG